MKVGVEPTRASLPGPVDYSAVSDFIKAHPLEAAEFIRDIIADDGMEECARRLRDYMEEGNT